MADQMTLPDFDGRTYEHMRDHYRLSRQALAVWKCLDDGKWWTLNGLWLETGYPQASISARIRDLRKPKFGGSEIEREYVANGVWRYRLVK